jgi:hypothetical protein
MLEGVVEERSGRFYPKPVTPFAEVDDCEVRMIKVTRCFAVRKFTGDGEFLTSWGVCGYAENSYPAGLAADERGNVYVPEPDRRRIEVFTSSGTSVGALTFQGDGAQYWEPFDLAFRGGEIVYVVDPGNARVQKFALPRPRRK